MYKLMRKGNYKDFAIIPHIYNDKTTLVNGTLKQSIFKLMEKISQKVEGC